MSDVETVELDSLVGEHVFDGCDMSTEQVKTYGDYFEDANVIRLRLDGKVYVAIENPEDGYRSSMDRLFVDGDTIKNAFPPVRVLARKKGGDNYSVNDIIELIDMVTGKVVAEFGTDNTADYYPCFVAIFCPENMATNSQS